MLIHKVIKKYLDYKFSSTQNQLKDKSEVHYSKLPYISNLPHHIKTKLSKFCKESWKENFNRKLVCNPFKIKIYFSYKDPIPNELKSYRNLIFFKHLHSTATCFDSYNPLCFKIIDKASSKFDLKLYILTGENLS